jgi:tRNA 2-selenouridine synthase
MSELANKSADKSADTSTNTSAGEAVGGEKGIWLEDESRRIGLVNIPDNLYRTIRTKPVYFLEIPFEDRLKVVVEEYGKFEKEKLARAILLLRRRMGGSETKSAVLFLEEGDFLNSFRILLKYYDKYYLKDCGGNESSRQVIPITTGEIIDNSL